MKIDKSQNSEFGNFNLVPEEGMKLRSFIDHISELLVVSESLIDTSQLPSEHGMTLIPSEQIIVDVTKRKILNPIEWKEYFNYEIVETTTPDGKLKEIVQRIHEPDRNTDSLNYSLLNLETNEYIFKNGSSVAFQEKPRESSVKRYYESLENRKKYLRSLELGKYSITKHDSYLKELKDGETIIQYFNEKEVCELKNENDIYVLYNTQKPSSREGWESLKLKQLKTFIKLEDFWQFLIIPHKSFFGIKAKKPWYSNYSLRLKSRAVEKYIIEEHNNIVQSKIVPYKEYQDLNNWMNISYNEELERNVFWQFCANCRVRVFYNPRYPNHACRKCVDKIRDNNGNELNYRDKHQLEYVKDRFVLLLKESNEEVKIYLNEVEYYATEARFGGVVHQLKE